MELEEKFTIVKNFLKKLDEVNKYNSPHSIEIFSDETGTIGGWDDDIETIIYFKNIDDCVAQIQRLEQIKAY